MYTPSPSVVNISFVKSHIILVPEHFLKFRFCFSNKVHEQLAIDMEKPHWKLQPSITPNSVVAIWDHFTMDHHICEHH